MKTPIIALATLTSLAASPVAAQDWSSVFRTSGWVAGGYDSLINMGSAVGDVSVAVPFSFGGFEVFAGIHVEGYALTAAPVVGDVDFFAGLSGSFGDFYVGDVPHATTALMPRIRKSVSPWQELFLVDAVLEPTSFSWLDIVVPVDFLRVRYDGSFGDFAVSASYEFTTQNAAAAASYAFGNTTVYGGIEGVAGFAAISLMAGVESSFDKFDIAAEVFNWAGTTVIAANVEATYHINDAFSVSGMAGARTGLGVWNIGAAADYQINDYAKASVGVNRTGGINYLSAGFRVDLD